jgi:hypothetical protein
MAHFAQIDDNSMVAQVIVINNRELLDENGAESEKKGAEFCQSLFGGEWVQTSYAGKFRGGFAGIGHKYDKAADLFVRPSDIESSGAIQRDPEEPMRDFPYQMEHYVAQRRPWARALRAAAPYALACAIGAGFGLALAQWWGT